VTRWNRRLLLGAVAVLVPVLAGCEAGYNAPTLQYHPAANGAYFNRNGITIDNAFVLAPASGLHPGDRAGIFMGLQAENGDKLQSVSAPGTANSVKVAGNTVNLPAQQLVELYGPNPKVVLTGLSTSLAAGENVNITFTFAEAGSVTLQVPVEPRNYEYATYGTPAPTPTAQPKPTPTNTTSPKVSPGASGTASVSIGASTQGNP
jgi:copper(I)-binding protein